jgi:putative inorganic carbon (hco3(-)) transporter
LWILLYYSASRGVLLALLCGTILTTKIYRQYTWPFFRVLVISMLTGLAGYYALLKTSSYANGSDLTLATVLRNTTEDRIQLWKNALQLWIEHPFLGIGPMNFPWYSSTFGHPHNSLLQLLAECGFPATILLLLIFGNGVCHWVKRFDTNYFARETSINGNLVVILFFTLITNVFYSLVDGVIVMPISQVLMFTIIGVMIGHYNTDTCHQQKDKLTNINHTLKIVSIACTILFTLLWSASPEIVKAFNNNEKRFSMGYDAAGPRFWWEIK